MSVDLYAGSTEFNFDAACVPIVLPNVPNTSIPNTGIPDGNVKVARITFPRPLEIEVRQAAGQETSSAGPNVDSFAWKVEWFAYRAARRLLGLNVADILALDLDQMRETLPEKSKFDFRFLSADEIRSAAGDPVNDLDVNIAERLERGRNYCVGAFEGGRLVNYSWYALDHVEPEHSFGAGLTLPQDAIYMHKAFTLPEYRGQRVHQATIHRASRIFARMGIRRLIAIVEYGNWASLRSHERMGCRRTGRLWMLRRKLVAQQGDIGLKAFRSFSESTADTN